MEAMEGVLTKKWFFYVGLEYLIRRVSRITIDRNANILIMIEFWEIVYSIYGTKLISFSILQEKKERIRSKFEDIQIWVILPFSILKGRKTNVNIFAYFAS